MSTDTFIAVGFSLLTTAVWAGLIAYMKKMFKKLSAAQSGMKAILYDRIVQMYNKYEEPMCLPIYARKTLDEVYKAYKQMDGNGTAESLYKKMMDWPTSESE